MKAKDTLMSREELEQVYRDGLIGWWLRIAQAQAELSFRAGIKEVVEYIHQHLIDPRVTGDLKTTITPWEWQAKLKEWGIEE